jgi:hypothetical protein
MYTEKNFKTKKQLKEAVKRWNEYQAMKLSSPRPMTAGAVLLSKLSQNPPKAVRYFQPGPFGGSEPTTGAFCVEGPHYPEPHRWYAECTAKDGVIIKVK